MKSNDLQKLVLFKYETGQTPKKIFKNLNSMIYRPNSRTVVYYNPEEWRHRLINTIHLSQNSSLEDSHTKSQKKIKEISCKKWYLKWTCLSQMLIEFSGKILK